MVDRASIISALMSKLSAAGLGYSISWPNREAEPVKPFLEADFALSDPTRVGMTALHRYTGLFQVAVIVAENVGAVEAARVADAISAAFPTDDQFPAGLNTVRITKAPAIGGGFNDGGGYRLPVTIPFEVIA